MSSSHMISEETMYVKKLGEFYDATVYALSPNRSLREDSHGAALHSYANNLAGWLARGILSSQSLSKMLISAKPLLSPEIRCGRDQRNTQSSLPARILDDLLVCKTRAYYTSKRTEYKSRKEHDMEISKKHGSAFIKNYLIPKIASLSASEESLNNILTMETEKTINICYQDLDKEIIGVIDAVIIAKIRSTVLRVIIVEVADTDTNTFLKKKHILPRILIYMSAYYLCYGIIPVGLYISLSPGSDPPALLILSKKILNKGLPRLLKKIKELSEMEEEPEPSGDPPCSHCVYANICKFRR